MSSYHQVMPGLSNRHLPSTLEAFFKIKRRELEDGMLYSEVNSPSIVPYCVGLIFSICFCVLFKCSGSSAHNCPGADATFNTESSWEGVAIIENHVEDESWVTSFAKTKTMGIESFVTTHKEQKQKPTKSCDSPNVHPSELRSETMMIRNWSMIINPLSVICVEVCWRLVAITTLQQIPNTRSESSEWIRYIAI